MFNFGFLSCRRDRQPHGPSAAHAPNTTELSCLLANVSAQFMIWSCLCRPWMKRSVVILNLTAHKRAVGQNRLESKAERRAPGPFFAGDGDTVLRGLPLVRSRAKGSNVGPHSDLRQCPRSRRC